MLNKDEFRSMDDIEIVHHNLGKGYTSTVSLVQHKVSKRKYALKTVSHLF